MPSPAKHWRTLARNVADLRAQKRLSQAALAERAGISTKHLSTIERAAAAPTVDTIARIGQALGASVARLFADFDDSGVLVSELLQDRSAAEQKQAVRVVRALFADR